MVIRVRRQPVRELDASAIQERTSRCDGDEHGRVSMLDDSHGGGSEFDQGFAVRAGHFEAQSKTAVHTHLASSDRAKL